jgi:hypothetical protein
MAMHVDPTTLSNPGPVPRLGGLKLAASILTILGLVLFGYFVYAVGLGEILDGIARFGVAGFAVIVAIYFLRICSRSFAWQMCIGEPHSLRIRDIVPAVIIGEALSSTIPIGIAISGTAKAIAVRKRIPLVVGFSSIATENLFYSLITTLFLISGAVVLLQTFMLDPALITAVNLLIVILFALVGLGFLLVIRQWHAASAVCEWLYGKGVLPRLLDEGRVNVRRFEDLIYQFYRRYPARFLPICLLELVYHIVGIFEIWYILSRLTEVMPPLLSAFLLESISRLITIIFKLIPFVVGVDEAGAQLITETLGLGVGLGVTVAVIRKGRMLFWAAVGFAIIVKRQFPLRDTTPLSEPTA